MTKRKSKKPRHQASVVCVAGIKIRLFGCNEFDLQVSTESSSSSSPSNKPVVFVSHGRLQTVEKIIPICVLLAQSGMIAIAIEARNHGERLVEESCNHGWNRNPMHESDMYAMQVGTALDIKTVIDFLPCRLPNLSLERIGVTGVSLGGHIAFLAMVLDQRISVGVPMIGSANYKLLMEIRIKNFLRRLQNKVGNQQSSSSSSSSSSKRKTKQKRGADIEFVKPPFAPYSPHLLELIRTFDPICHPQVFADRPLLMISGEKDTLVPTVTNQTFHDIAKQFYADESRIKLVQYQGIGHRVTPDMVTDCVSWLRHWLIENWSSLENRSTASSSTIHHNAINFMGKLKKKSKL